MKRRIFENVFQDDEFLDRKEELFDYLHSIGMDSNADESYADINKDGENDTLLTHFDMGNVTVYVGLCNFSNGDFKYLLMIKSGGEVILTSTFFNTVDEIEKNVSKHKPHIILYHHHGQPSSTPPPSTTNELPSSRSSRSTPPPPPPSCRGRRRGTL